jgi:hypothetical protein
LQKRALSHWGTELRTLGRRKEAIAVYDDLLARFGNATEAPIREHVAKAESARTVCESLEFWILLISARALRQSQSCP